MDDLLRVALEETSFLSPENDNTEELLARVKSIIPVEENKYKPIAVQGDSGKFKATIRTTFRNEEDIAMFIQKYGLKNNETLRITKRRKRAKKVNIY